jgi:hypothetical protein
MASTSGLKKPRARDVAYYRQRQKNHVAAALLEFFIEEAERINVTRKDWAEAAGKDPAQLTRWLTSPSNFELDTLSDLLLALGAEMEHRIVRFSDQPRPNFVHPLMADSGGITASSQPRSLKRITPSGHLSGTKVEVKIA